MTDPTPDKIMEVGPGFWCSKVLVSAIEMGLFTELSREPGDPNQDRRSDDAKSR